MVNYKLVKRVTNQAPMEINWNIDKYFNCDNKSLESIDLFTSQFENQEELKNELSYIGAISDTIGMLSITYKVNNEINILKYGIMYKSDYVFLNANSIIAYLKEYCCDDKLLIQIINKYYYFTPNKKNIDVINKYVNKLKNRQNSNKDDEEIKLVVEDFVNRLVYKYDSKKRTYIKNADGNKECDYRKLRDLAMLLSNNSKELKRSLNIDNPKVKLVLPSVIKRKNYEVPGQISLFDIGLSK